MRSYWGWANLLSVGNLSCGVLSVQFSVSHRPAMAFAMLLAGVAFDFLDGKTARFFHEESTFGKALDSLSDMTTFGISPAAASLAAFPRIGAVGLGIFTLFVCAGGWRLAYFIQWNKKERPPGMPITINGIIFPAVYAMAHFGGVPAWIFPAAAGLSIAAMTGPIFARPRLVA